MYHRTREGSICTRRISSQLSIVCVSLTAVSLTTVDSVCIVQECLWCRRASPVKYLLPRSTAEDRAHGSWLYLLRSTDSNMAAASIEQQWLSNIVKCCQMLSIVEGRCPAGDKIFSLERCGATNTRWPLPILSSRGRMLHLRWRKRCLKSVKQVHSRLFLPDVVSSSSKYITDCVIV